MIEEHPIELKTETFTVKKVEPYGIIIQTFDNQEFIFTIKEISQIYTFANGKRNN